ncbi:MAG: site-2 protease family protein [Thermoflexales bacterium]
MHTRRCRRWVKIAADTRMAEAFAIFVAGFGVVWLLERRLHQLVQTLFLLLTGHNGAAMKLFAVVLLPGVFLHELSHWLMARLLGVRVRRFSVMPKPQRNGALRLGYVEVMRTDLLRTALIGIAPLAFGVAALSAIGLRVFNLRAIAEALSKADLISAAGTLLALPQAPDAWLWAYVVFAVANSMMPSESDVQALPPVVFGGFVVVGAVLIVGGLPLMQLLSPLIRAVLSWLAAAFAITAVLDLAIALALMLAIWLIGTITQREVRLR